MALKSIINIDTQNLGGSVTPQYQGWYDHVNYSAYVLQGDFSNYGHAIHLGYLGNQDIRDRVTGQPIVNFQLIDEFDITGTAFDDAMESTNNYGSDTFRGMGGNDALYSMGGDDYLDGGDGNDYLDGGDGNDILLGGDGNDSLYGGNGNDQLYAGPGNDYLDGGVGDDTIYGNYGTNTLIGGDGSDTIYGGYGVDNINGSVGNDVLYGGAGDTLSDIQGINDFYATEAAYVIGSTGSTLHSDYQTNNAAIHLTKNLAGSGANIDNGLGGVLHFYGPDTVAGPTLNLDLQGSAFNDVIGDNFDLWGNDYIHGNGGNDFINGGRGNDTLFGDDGNDILAGGAGDDLLAGGTGDDQISATFGSDYVDAGDGNDVIYAVAGVNQTQAIKQIYGGDGADTFILDASGVVTNSITFDTTKLANFINDITLPANPSINWDKLGNDIAFDVWGAAVGSAPIVGSGLQFLVSLGKTGYDTDQQQKQVMADIEAQKAKAIAAVDNSKYSADSWAQIVQSGVRDVITIKDFKIGVDSILLPKLSLGQSYDFIDSSFNGKTGVFIRIQTTNSNEQSKNVAFIENTYGSDTGIDQAAFKKTLIDLLQNSKIGVFTQTAVIGDNNPGGSEIIGNGKVSFANDRIYADGGYFDDKGFFLADHADGGNDTVYGYFGDDIIYGEGGDDILYGGSNGLFSNLEGTVYKTDGNDFLIGGNGKDTLYGGSGNDYLNGDYKDTATNTFIYSGNDYLDGGSGDDRLEGGFGVDTLHGGEDNDTLYGGEGQDSLFGGTGNDVLYGDGDNDFLLGEEGDDLLIGGTGDDSLNGGIGDDHLEAGDGKDAVDGGAGNDTLNGAAGDDTLNGQDGNDLLFADIGNDLLVGASGDDHLIGWDGMDKLYGGTGDDVLEGGLGDDLLNDTEGTISGGDGVDTLQADYSSMGYGINHDAGVHLGTIGGVSAVFERNDGAAILTFDTVENFNVTGTGFNDHLESGAGTDTLAGGAGDDELFGNAGNDVLNGGLGNNTLDGGQGNDTYIVSSISDLITEAAGGGIDTVKSSVSFSLADFIENLTLTGTTALNGTGNTLNNVMVGNNFANTLLGLAGNDNLSGNAGNDVLNGGNGNDTLNGGLGNDNLVGGLGNDTLTGGAGLDKFFFNAAFGATNKDTITDFNVADDTIVLENAIFSKFVATGAIAADSFVSGAGAVAHDANDFLVYNTTNGALSYDADGSGLGAAVQIATLVGVPTLTAADFLIV